MSYNIRYLNNNDGQDHWKNRVDAVGATVTRADIIGLQEATKPQIDQVAAFATNYDWYGVGRDDGAERGEYTPIFWKRDRFIAEDQGTFWLGSDPSAVGKPDWGANLPRICSWVVLKDSTAKHSLLVMNTHFDHQSAEAREKSATLIKQQAEKLIKRFANIDAIVLTGDFNCQFGSKPIEELASPESSGFTFADSQNLSEMPASGPTGTWNGFKRISEGQRIDFVFIHSETMKVAAHETLDPKTAAGRFASDHLPVMITLK